MIRFFLGHKHIYSLLILEFGLTNTDVHNLSSNVIFPQSPISSKGFYGG